MRRSLAKFSEPEASNQTPSLADFIITTSGFRFLVHTGLAYPLTARTPEDPMTKPNRRLKPQCARCSDNVRLNHPRRGLVRSIEVCPASPPTPLSRAGAL